MSKDTKDSRLVQIGTRLRELRKAKGYTNYEKFAYEHDIASSQYARYELGQDFKMTTFLKILDALEISPLEFFSEGFDQ